MKLQEVKQVFKKEETFKMCSVGGLPGSGLRNTSWGGEAS